MIQIVPNQDKRKIESNALLHTYACLIQFSSQITQQLLAIDPFRYDLTISKLILNKNKFFLADVCTCMVFRYVMIAGQTEAGRQASPVGMKASEILLKKAIENEREG